MRDAYLRVINSVWKSCVVKRECRVWGVGYIKSQDKKSKDKTLEGHILMAEKTKN